MLDFARNANYDKNEQRCESDETPCIICGKGVKNPWRYTVHLFYGNTLVTADEAQSLDESGDLGAWPIGDDCLKKHPEVAPYLSTH